MSNKIYQCTNKIGRRTLVIAESEEQAIDISANIGLVKERNNVDVEDITDSYLTSVKKRYELDIDKLSPGQLVGSVFGGTMHWTTCPQ